jgi:thymidylate kinase
LGRRSPILIALQGVDGTGKSTQAALLATRLSALGLPTVVIWNRWTPYVVGLVRSAAHGIAGRAEKRHPAQEANDTVAAAVAGRPVLAYVFSRVAWLEYLVQTRWRLLTQGHGASVIVLDRYVADMVVDRARRLGWSNDRIAREAQRAYRRGYPRPDLTIFLDLSLSAVMQRRPDEQPRALEERSELYRRIAGLLGAPVIEAEGSIEFVAERVWEMVEASVSAGRQARQ